MQDYTLFHEEPPNPLADPTWSDRVRHRRVEIVLDSFDLFSASTPKFCYVGVYDAAGRELCRRDATQAELHDGLVSEFGKIRLIREFRSEVAPAAWTVTPYAECDGWLKSVTGVVPRDGET